jgi:hypothetical protein
MIDVLEHPLVAGYLRDLDAALAGLPVAAAAELSEQLRAHLLEALPPDADEDAVMAVLAALGPARLVAEAAGPASQPGRAGPGRTRRCAGWRPGPGGSRPTSGSPSRRSPSRSGSRRAR